MFNAARGSLLIPVLFHFQLSNPLWPDSMPWDSLVLALLAAGVVWVDRRSYFSRDAAATLVTPALEVGAPGPGTLGEPRERERLA
jgi:hypothetical protein